MKIMVVEDERIVALDLARQLTDPGHDVARVKGNSNPIYVIPAPYRIWCKLRPEFDVAGCCLRPAQPCSGPKCGKIAESCSRLRKSLDFCAKLCLKVNMKHYL